MITMINIMKLARRRREPGITRLINCYNIDDKFYFVDLPGYGYAKRSKSEIDKLDRMIRGYILQRQQLTCVFTLVDVRLEPQKIDLEFINWLGQSGIPFCILFTKADKLSQQKVQLSVEAYKRKLSETWEEMPPMIVTSSEDRRGRDELLDYIDSVNKQLKEGND